MTKSQNTKDEQQKDLCITSEQLTEKWKKGELPDGLYYVKDKRDIIRIDYFADVWDYTDIDEIDEVLAPVPSYQDYERLNWYAGDGVEENTKLKELLKECKALLSCLQIDDYDGNGLLLLNKINQALGEE